ncbi:MAG: hypothetical protein HY342_13130 [Candidatus Lambdaproteobacteria bacterium]|nr:hypothetical protein [Candidatus Lambdaproteobacteria bacterium]
MNAAKSHGSVEAVTTDSTSPETLEAFKNSFSYGSRTDLLFKFLKRLPDAEAAEFLRALLEKLGETVDDGDVGRLLEHIYEWNVRGYATEVEEARSWIYDEGPFTPLAKPLSQSRLGLLTASGHFVAGHDPEPFGVKDMTQAEAVPRIQEFLRGPPQLNVIPIDTPAERLRVRHPGYDIRAVLSDPNVALPLAPLREAATAGVIGGLAAEAYSFVGATAQTPLIHEHAPRWVERMRAQHVDAVLLVPV